VTRRRPNAAEPETPPGAVVRTWGTAHAPAPAWEADETPWPARREATKARWAEARAQRRKINEEEQT
jgi:hypothetical protein